MNICKDCIYWGDGQKGWIKDFVVALDNGESTILNNCGCPRWHYGYGRSEDFRKGDIEVEYDEGWGALMSADFGCIHFLKKED